MEANFDDARIGPQLNELVENLVWKMATDAAANPVAPSLPVLN